jgi:hypothetical protein
LFGKSVSSLMLFLILACMLASAFAARAGANFTLSSTVPPTVSNVSQVPDKNSVNDSEAVVVSANVTDNSGTGIANVTIVYSPDGWTINSTAAMALNSSTGLFDGTIPGFLSGTIVYYVIQAYDNNGGFTESTRTTYTVVSKAGAQALVRVTEITPSSTWVYQGQVVSVNVTVSNNGDSAEKVWATLFYNLTSERIIGAYTSAVILDMGQSYTFPFTWDTTGIPYHTYTLTAVAWISGGSNTLSGNITVRLIGDVNGDGKVDLRDLALVARAFGSTPASPNWNSAADINGDGVVNMKDLALIGRYFGRRTAY